MLKFIVRHTAKASGRVARATSDTVCATPGYFGSVALEIKNGWNKGFRADDMARKTTKASSS